MSWLQAPRGAALLACLSACVRILVTCSLHLQELTLQRMLEGFKQAQQLSTPEAAWQLVAAGARALPAASRASQCTLAASLQAWQDWLVRADPLSNA